MTEGEYKKTCRAKANAMFGKILSYLNNDDPSVDDTIFEGAQIFKRWLESKREEFEQHVNETEPEVHQPVNIVVFKPEKYRT